MEQFNKDLESLENKKMDLYKQIGGEADMIAKLHKSLRRNETLDVENIIFQEKINAWFNRSVRVLEKCKNCKYRYICGTGCPAAKHMSENNMNIKEPSCVEYNELIKTIILEKMKRI